MRRSTARCAFLPKSVKNCESLNCKFLWLERNWEVKIFHTPLCQWSGKPSVFFRMIAIFLWIKDYPCFVVLVEGDHLNFPPDHDSGLIFLWFFSGLASGSILANHWCRGVIQIDVFLNPFNRNRIILLLVAAVHVRKLHTTYSFMQSNPMRPESSEAESGTSTR